MSPSRPADPGPEAPTTPAGAGPAFAPAPAPSSERGAWLLAIAMALVGLAVLVAVLTGSVGQSEAAPAPAVIYAPTPTPAAASSAGELAAAQGAAILSRPSTGQQLADAERFNRRSQVQIDKSWMAGFYPIYETAQRTFAVNWLLLASIHMQETAFSTAAGTYHGLNFAHCCGGPMQFNVTNGPLTTWDLVSDSYRDGPRPASYHHMTATHPSIYDDFDAIMAAAHLLSADGAGYDLGDSAWVAAYDYYGHDETGVIYADQVLARAIGWSQHGFCIDCETPAALVQAVHEAYGAPVLAALTAPAPSSGRSRQRARSRGRS